MSPDGPVRMPVTGSLAAVVECPSSLLDVTLDQLRTLLAVHHAGSPLRAAQLLGREHSSVRKQLDHLNRTFQRLCGEQVAIKRGRGQDYLFTPTGEMAVEQASRLFSGWLAGVTEQRRRLGESITVAATEFTVDFLSEVWPTLADEFSRREVELNIVHVRTRDFQDQLDDKVVDLVCGSMPVEAGYDLTLDAFDVIEWHRERLALLTNLSERELPVASISHTRFAVTPILAPTGGLIAQFLTRWYGPDYRNKLQIVAEVDTIYYGLALLRSNLVRAGILTTEATARAALEGRLPAGPGMRLVNLADDFEPSLQMLAGVFARKGERERYDETHPLNMLWKAFEENATGTRR